MIVDLPTLTEKDKDDLVNFGLPQEVDFIAASFVRKGSDIDAIRKVRREQCFIGCDLLLLLNSNRMSLSAAGHSCCTTQNDVPLSTNATCG